MAKRLLVTALSCSAIVYGVWYFVCSKASATPPPTLTVADEDLHIGTIDGSEGFHCKVRFANTTDKEVTISRFATSCSCVECQPQQMVLPPHGQGEIGITLSMQKVFAGVAKDAFEAPIDVKIAPFSGTQTILPSPWHLLGKACRHIIFERTPYSLNNNLTRGGPFPTEVSKLTLAPGIPADAVSVSCDPRYATAAVRFQYPSDQMADAVLTLNPKMEAGPVSFSLDFAMKPTAQGPTVRYSLPVTGQILENVQILPPRLVFAPQPVGHRHTGLVALTSTVGQKFDVEKIEAEDARVSIAKTERPAVYQISLTVKAEGQHSTRVWFVVHSDDENRHIKLSVEIHYYGLPN